MPAFRKRLLDAVGNEQVLFDEREFMVEQLTDQLVGEFFDYMWTVRERRSGRPSESRAENRAWNMLHLVLSPILGKANASRFFGWEGRTATPPEMILMELQRIRRKANG
jgi:hypothetical protein